MLEITMGDTFGGAREITYSKTVSSGGEIQVRLDEDSIDPVLVDHIDVSAWLTDSDAIMEMFMVCNAISEHLYIVCEREVPCHLKVGYLPYARQDRVYYEGEAHASWVMTTLLNTLTDWYLTVVDPHSNAAIENLYTDVITQSEIFATFRSEILAYTWAGDLSICAPDKGATQKAEAVNSTLRIDTPIIQGTKIRDPKTGDLTGFGYKGDVEGASILIVDDICDGGGTFLGLAAELRKGGAEEIGLYVTHGIFSQGVDKLLDNGIDYIITTNTIEQKDQNSIFVLDVL